MSAILKAFSVSKIKAYLDGDPLEYVSEVKFPEIASKEVDVDNSSFAGAVSVGDPFSLSITGGGEIKIEGTDPSNIRKLFNPIMLQTLYLVTAESNINPQSGILVPVPITYTATVQFFSNDLGTFMSGSKRDHVAKFKLYSIMIKEAGQTMVEIDFLNGVFKNNGVDLIESLTGVL